MAWLCGLVLTVLTVGEGDAATPDPWRELERYRTKQLTPFPDAPALEVFRRRVEAATSAWDSWSRRARLPTADQLGRQGGGFVPASAPRSFAVVGDLAYVGNGEWLTTVSLAGTPGILSQSALNDPKAQSFQRYAYSNIWVEGRFVVVQGGNGLDSSFLVWENTQGKLSLRQQFVTRGSGTVAAGKVVLYHPSLDSFEGAHAGADGKLDSMDPPRRSYQPLYETRGASLHRVSVCELATGQCDTTVIAAAARGEARVFRDALYLWVAPWTLTREKARPGTLYRVPLNGSAVSAVYLSGEARAWQLDAVGRLDIVMLTGSDLSLLRLPPSVLDASLAEKPVQLLPKAVLATESVPLARPFAPQNWFSVSLTDSHVFYGAGYDPDVDPVHPQLKPEYGASVTSLFAQSVNGGPTRRPVFEHFNFRSLQNDSSFGAYRVLPLEDGTALVQRDDYVQVVSPEQAENSGRFERLPGAASMRFGAFARSADGLVAGYVQDDIPNRRRRVAFLRIRDRRIQLLAELVNTDLNTMVQVAYERGRWLVLVGDELLEAAVDGDRVRTRWRLSLSPAKKPSTATVGAPKASP
ncbi:MAG: hypothetical protein ABUL60_23670 [Myxococcales bacterium]